MKGNRAGRNRDTDIKPEALLPLRPVHYQVLLVLAEGDLHATAPRPRAQEPGMIYICNLQISVMYR